MVAKVVMRDYQRHLDSTLPRLTQSLMTPIFLLYVIGQRFFIEGIAMTGIKG